MRRSKSFHDWKRFIQWKEDRAGRALLPERRVFNQVLRAGRKRTQCKVAYDPQQGTITFIENCRLPAVNAAHPVIPTKEEAAPLTDVEDSVDDGEESQEYDTAREEEESFDVQPSQKTVSRPRLVPKDRYIEEIIAPLQSPEPNFQAFFKTLETYRLAKDLKNVLNTTYHTLYELDETCVDPYACIDNLRRAKTFEPQYLQSRNLKPKIFKAYVDAKLEQLEKWLQEQS